MPANLLNAASFGPCSYQTQECAESLLAGWTEELAGLRFSILLTARWEASASEDFERRSELREDLVRLRRQYSQKIDDIALTFGIQNAMHAKEEVERNVFVACTQR